MAPSPWVATRLRCLPDAQVPSPQSKAQPWKDGGLAQVANLNLSDTSSPALLLPSLPRLRMNYLPDDSLHP